MKKEIDHTRVFPAKRLRAVLGLMLAGSLAGAPAARASDSPPQRTWPLARQPAISSNFCEYREGHFHAGLDLRTFGEEGVPCRASSDGYISRIRVSSFGYGKAVYVQCESGETLVYAHLSEFSPELEEAGLKEQIKAGNYELDFRFAPGRFPVKRGDVIAYSGSTGTAAPHLHFEIRDRGENPLNPFSHGFAVDDEIPPQIRCIDLLPLDADARVNGRCFPLQVKTVRTGPDSFVVPDTLLLEGEVGVSAEVFDRLNPASGKLAPFHAGLNIDGESVAEIMLERFSFNHTSQVDFLYDMAHVRLKKEYFIRLFSRDGEKLWNRSFANEGRLNSPGEDGDKARRDGVLHSAVVSAADRAGNRSELRMYYRDASAEPIESPRQQKQESPPAEIPGFYFFEDFMSVWFESDNDRMAWLDRLACFGVTDARNDNTAGFAVCHADQFLDFPVVVPYHTGKIKNYIHLFGVKKGRSRSVNIPALDLQIVFGEKTLYCDMIMYAAGWEGDNSSLDQGELVPSSRIARIGPYSGTLKADMEIRFVVPRPDSAHAIYRLNEQKMEWVFYKSTVGDGVVSTTARRPGMYAVLSDQTGPRIGNPYVGTHTSYATGLRVPEIVIPVEDGGSGLDAGVTAVYVEGVKQIARWDDNQKKMFILIRDTNIIGPQALSVAACDKIGNRSRLDTTIDVQHSKRQGNE